MRLLLTMKRAATFVATLGVNALSIWTSNSEVCAHRRGRHWIPVAVSKAKSAGCAVHIESSLHHLSRDASGLARDASGQCRLASKAACPRHVFASVFSSQHPTGEEVWPHAHRHVSNPAHLPSTLPQRTPWRTECNCRTLR